GVVHGSGHGHLSRHHRQVSDTDVSDTTVSIWRWGVRRPGTDEETAVAPARAGALLTVVCAAQFMVVLDISVVNVALPSMRTSLGFTDAGLAWVVNAYALVFAGLLLV